MDILIKNADIITMDDDNTVIRNGSVIIEGGKITYVGTKPPNGTSKGTIDARGGILMPGIINAHTHLPMNLLRGYADDVELHTWLNDWIFPAEDKLDARAARAGAILGIAECIASGVTSVSDMYNFCDEITGAVAEAGIKANIARGFVCFDPKADFYALPAVKESLELIKNWQGYDNGRIKIEACIHAEYTSSPGFWRKMADFSAERGLGIQVHISETKKEHNECVTRHGTTPVVALYEAGLFKNPVTAAHCVWIDVEDMDILKETGASVVSCPVSNLKLASGIAPVTEMLRRGINVAVGTDSAASNNNLDMFEEIKLLATLHKGDTLNPFAIPARQALGMATRNGAKAQRRDGECGAVKVGLDADLVLVDGSKPHMIPKHDVLSNLVYSARGADVAMTMVRGKILYRNGEFLTIDMERLVSELKSHALPLLFGDKTLM